MATFTPNYNLDLYESTDKPNLRDQYNGAMNKLDDILHTQQTNIDNAVTTANKALELSNTQGEAIDRLETTTGEHTTAIGTLQTQMTQAQQDITANTTAISDEVTARTQQVNGIDTRLTAVEESVAQQNLTDIVFIGDSYGTGYQPSGGALSNNIPVLTAQYLGLTLHNFCNNASGYITIGDGGLSFGTIETNAYNDSVANDYNDKVKYVVVMGGRNDSSTTTGFESSAEAVLQAAKEHFPTAKVCALYMWDAYRRPNDNQIANFRSLMSVCNRNGILTDSKSIEWGLLEIFMFAGDNGTDIHPNGTGCEFFAGCIAQVLTGGDPQLYHAYALDTQGVRFYKNGHQAIIQFNGLNITGNSDVNIATGIPDCLSFGTLQPCITNAGQGLGWCRCDSDGNGYSATLKFIGGVGIGDATTLPADAGTTFFTGTVDLLTGVSG